MPLTTSAFPEEVQVALFVYDMLTDVWDGMSGSFMGKDWAGAPLIFEIYEIQNRKEVLYIAKMYERIVMSARFKEADKKRKAEERKQSSAGGGKKFTHNVRG